MVHELANLNVKYHNVLVMAGWFGQLKSIYKQQLTYRKMRVLELDRAACETSDYVFNLDNLTEHKVKAVCANINDLTLHKNGYEWSVENFRDGTTYTEKFLPDLIINTSPARAADELVGKIAGASALLFESLYNPWPTALMGFWRNVGLESIDGLDLLVHQAISQISIFAGTPVKRSQLAPLMREAALKRI